MPRHIQSAALTAFLQTLIRTQTLSGAEKPGLDLVAAEMNRLQFDAINADAYGNVVGLINGNHAGPTLLLDAHIDTVPVSPGLPWNYEPFGATIDNGRMYGRGTADMKGALAAMIHAAAAVDRSQLAGRIIVCASVMEEVMEGIPLTPVIEAYAPDLVVIGEATDLNVVHGGRGRAELQLEALGIPTHSSTPHLGRNAIHVMMGAIGAIEALPMHEDPLLGPSVMGLTDIISDPYPGHSVIPSRCLATYDRRLLAEETIDSVLGELQALPEMEHVNVRISDGSYTTYTGAVLTCPKFFPAWKLPSDHAFVQQALAGVRTADLDPNLSAYRFNTNATYTAGLLGIPTIGFGPAQESRAHMIDEYIELDELEAAARGYLGIMETLR